MKAPSLTLGIEEEYQVVDPETRELESYVSEILEDDSVVLENVHPELHASTLEVASRVCSDLDEAREEPGVRSEVEHAYRLMEEGTSAERQLEVYEESGDLAAVVDQLVAETGTGL